MAQLIVEGDDLVVRPSPLEKLGACRGDVRVPLRAVRDLRPIDDLWPRILLRQFVLTQRWCQSTLTLLPATD
jgi:hypothetical protein